jgi:hypothetical protein
VIINNEVAIAIVGALGFDLIPLNVGKFIYVLVLRLKRWWLFEMLR